MKQIKLIIYKLISQQQTKLYYIELKVNKLIDMWKAHLYNNNLKMKIQIIIKIIII